MTASNRVKTPTDTPLRLLVFPSDLGWIAVVMAVDVAVQLVFGYRSPAAAKRALDRDLVKLARPGRRDDPLVRRLKKYAAGQPDSFGDIRVDLGPPGGFRRRVLEQCRLIPYGQMVSYGELAARAGSPGAARAVGNCMAGNQIPLLIPCHRVVCADGRLGSYSAPGGVATKRRLLAMESHEIDLELNSDARQNITT